MKLKKIVSMLVVVMLVASAAAFAMAESTSTPATGEAAATEPAAAEPAQAEVYSLTDMMTQAMTDAYARQAAYAAYAAAFPDSASIANIDVDTQIVLLEMLLKANSVALPTQPEAVTAPETKTEAYQAIATAEADAAAMYASFLKQESLPQDARIIFATVLQSVRGNAMSFTRRAAAAQAQEQWESMLNSENTKTYTMQGPGGRGQWTVYVYNSNPDAETVVTNDEGVVEPDAAAAETAEPTETTAPTAGDSVSN